MIERLPQPVLSLRIASRREIATDIFAFELHDAGGADLPAFTAGSHIAVQTPGGSVRKYSLANDPAQRDRYLIAVKRDQQGRGASIDLIEATTEGAVIECSAPRNDFPLAAQPTEFIFIAGGIGITPIMSMVRQLQSTNGASFRLYYCTRDAAATAFRDELLAPEFRGQVVLHHDGGEPDRALDLWPILERPNAAHIYCCGPRPLLEAVRDMTGHWPPAAIHFESFVDAAATHRPEDRAFRVRLEKSGRTIEVGPNESILDAIRAAGVEAASSCEAGTCGTCRTTLLAGEAEHRDLVLTPAEQQQAIMICVSRARSDELVLER